MIWTSQWQEDFVKTKDVLPRIFTWPAQWSASLGSSSALRLQWTSWWGDKYLLTTHFKQLKIIILCKTCLHKYHAELSELQKRVLIPQTTRVLAGFLDLEEITIDLVRGIIFMTISDKDLQDSLDKTKRCEFNLLSELFPLRTRA